MFLRAGVLSLALLFASRLVGLVRESTLAAAFGASGMGDIAVLMLTLPDWLSSVLAGGALAYVLLPAWATEHAGRIAAMQRRVAHVLLLIGVLLAAAIAFGRVPLAAWLVQGLPVDLQPQAAQAVLWSAMAVPLALLAGLAVTRLQHERDFLGMYAASLFVNGVLIVTLAVVAFLAPETATSVLGVGLVVAMLARLAWLHHRQAPFRRAPALADAAALPPLQVWAWSAAAVGLPLALPFVSRSLASEQGPGALATFNYAWKLVELPLLLAVQLVGTLALGPISRAVREGDPAPMRRGFALAWTLACASVAGLTFASPAVAQLLFGWGRMQPEALANVAHWGLIGSWSLLPQALITIALAVLAAQGRIRVAVAGYLFALAALLLAPVSDSASLMLLLDLLWVGVALLAIWALGRQRRTWLPWPALGAAAATLLLLQVVAVIAGVPAGSPLQWASGIAAGLAVAAVTWFASRDLRQALAR